MERQPISREGYEKLREEIRQLEEEAMPKVREQIKIAREEGDLSENAEYHGQRETLSLLELKVSKLRAKLANSEIMDKSAMPKDVVAFGSIVTVKDLNKGSERQYELVGPGEEDYTCQPMKILTGSPIAQGLIGKKVGDQAEVEIPRGTLHMEITAIDDAADG